MFVVNFELVYDTRSVIAIMLTFPLYVIAEEVGFLSTKYQFPAVLYISGIKLTPPDEVGTIVADTP